MGFGVGGLGLGSGVWELEFVVEDSGFKVQSLGFRA